jgi:MerR family transcriptional regulator/heat shock protein HspR
LYIEVVKGKDAYTGRERDERFPKYAISVVAVITGVHTHTLRQYEEWGLVRPARTEGRTRRYSDADIETIREIARLAGKGINYAGIKEVLRLREEWCRSASRPENDR